MKKTSLFASAAAATFVLAASPVFAQGPFADVPTDHWAYQSVDKLQNKGIVIGYPDGTFGGKRAMTRYEFAVAIARLVELIPGTVTPPPPVVNNFDPNQYYNKTDIDSKLAGKANTSDLAGLATKEEVDAVRKLVNEFQNELTTLGVEVDAVKRRLDTLEGRVDFIENEMKRVKIGGGVNLMVRGNHRRGSSGNPALDQDGYGVATQRSGSILSESYVLHDLDLNIKARLSDTATAEAVLNFGNYLPFLNTVSSFAGSRSPGQGSGFSQAQEQTIYKLQLEAPIRLPGLGGVNLAVGRIPVQFTPYTLKLIDVDSYFYNDKTDLGDIMVDGGKAAFKLGPVGVTTFASKVDPIKYQSDIGGVGSGGQGLFAGQGFSPFNGTGAFLPAQSAITGPSSMPIENLAGARATFSPGSLGTIGLTYLAAGGPLTASNAGRAYNRVFVYGADVNANFSGIGVNGSYTVSNLAVGQVGNLNGGETSTVRDDETYAWDAAASYTTGALNLGAGYKYISPYFAAPGYWEKLGAWTNPVDVKGPYVKASYALGTGLTLAGEGHFYEGTGKATAQGGLDEDNKVDHFKVGLKYGLTSASSVDLGVEYSKFDFGRFSTPGAGNPTEIYYNIGYGFSFNPNTSFKFLYQIIDFNDKGQTALGGVGDGGVAAAQFSVKF
jgi:hypothetical protein